MRLFDENDDNDDDKEMEREGWQKWGRRKEDAGEESDGFVVEDHIWFLFFWVLVN